MPVTGVRGGAAGGLECGEVSAGGGWVLVREHLAEGVEIGRGGEWGMGSGQGGGRGPWGMGRGRGRGRRYGVVGCDRFVGDHGVMIGVAGGLAREMWVGAWELRARRVGVVRLVGGRLFA